MINPTAQALLDIHAAVFSPDAPITFKSGIVSPIYVDNRRLPFEPAGLAHRYRSFTNLIATNDLTFDVIAGIETGGIPHSAALAYTIAYAFRFCAQAAERTMAQSGGSKAVKSLGKRVLLIEDLITTGGSSLSGVEALQNEGATVVACLAIFSYEFPQASEAFSAVNVPLLDFDITLGYR